jgi:serine/threonine-protein kinase RsbW
MEDFITRQDDTAISCTFSSTLANIDRTIERIKDFLASRHIEYNRFELLFILREALNNAVIHGNASNSALRVHCTLSIAADTLAITVTDQGQGFDWQRQIMKKPVSTATTSGRGLNVMEGYGYAIRFNDAGNTLYLTKKII